MGRLEGFRCLRCAREHAPRETRYLCVSCGGNIEVVYDLRAVRRRWRRPALARVPDKSLWRYLPLLPVDNVLSASPIHAGWTPLYRAPRLAADLGLAGVFVKDEGRNPSASLKDRASAVVAARAAEEGERVVAAASTGNAAASLACAAELLPLKAVIFVPETAPPAKVAQLLVYGAQVIAVRGSYDEAFDLCVEACREYGWYNRNTGYNPFTREGKKTCAFEICEQIGWKVPDWVFVPVGDGNIISGIWKGFLELRALGWIERLPRLCAAQASGSDAVKRAVDSDGALRPVSGRTLADSIAVRLPRDGDAAVRAVRESSGLAVSVTDREILAAIPALARGSGVFAEPAAAAAYAGLRKAASAGRVRSRETVVVLATGSGLKDAQGALRSVGRPHRIAPSLAELRRLVTKARIGQ